MRILKTLISLSLVAGVALSSSSHPGKAVYNKWHETELERWLSDHDVPYPTPADRKDLENLIQKNWDSHVATPYQHWDVTQLKKYLKDKGVAISDTATNSKDALVNQVKAAWYEPEDTAHRSWSNVKDWILDSWTDSQLKAFCDHHGIPVPQPRKRDTLLEKARSNLDTIAKKAGETASYPGNWLYDTWTESDLKEWLDTYGFPVPQPTTRDKLIASVRRNSRLASLKAKEQSASASSSAQAAYQTLTDKLIDAWDETQLKQFCDTHGISVPQGSKANQIRALVRKHRAEILGDTSASASSAYGAATSNVGEQYARATDKASKAAQDAFNEAVDSWSESRLKGYLDARGIPVPHASKKDELRALVRKNSYKAANGWNAWTFDDFSYENLKDYLASSGDAAAKKVSEKSGATRDELLAAAKSAYASASSAGDSTYASVTSYLAKATDSVKQTAFDNWSESELKAYLDSYGISVPQGSTVNELRARARKEYTFFKYGTTTPTETILAKIQDTAKQTWQWVLDQLNYGVDQTQKKVHDTTEEVRQEL
ncbi:hypothetical protein VTK73DRAFT_6874 [Phialemonium thermophilum]|uniref:Meiotic sister chromatid recombination protein 1 n=1 Tax=Phialemonium thermophilum TaxID=223376 RepID=A0ABR3XUM0_9PEZI